MLCVFYVFNIPPLLDLQKKLKMLHIMKIKGFFMKIILLNEVVNLFAQTKNSKLEHVVIQFRFHNIHINDQAHFAFINMPLKSHHINICKNKL
jgi:hypothetical protein